MKMSSRLDIIIFGVTGFTGLRTIPYITNIIKSYQLPLTWGVAGRSEAKIKKMLTELGDKKGVSYSDVPIIIADINDEKSLRKMTSRARIIINAVGPYLFYGEQVIKACLQTSTHHVDITAEALFMERMQLLYHEEAKSKGVYIVSACGMGSIPAEMGIVYLKRDFEGTLNSVETIMYATITDLNLGDPAKVTVQDQIPYHATKTRNVSIAILEIKDIKGKVVKVSGINPAHGLTCAAFALSAVMILTESDKMPDKRGVHAPGVGFAKTSIIEKLMNVMKMSSRLDIIIFGVTGFTGLRTIPYITNIIKSYQLPLTWGVAGRSEAKIKQMLTELGVKKGVSYSDVPIIIADINDEKSLRKMTSRARIIINVVGPYLLYGEQIIKACLQTYTHHVDITAETLFMERMQLLYHEEAKSKGVYIVSACGMGSIPAEMGIVYLKRNFEGTLNSVETFMYATITDLNLGGPAVNAGTYHSLVLSLSNFFKARAQRKLLFKTKLPTMQPKLGIRPVHKNDLINRWCLLLPESDPPVVTRSQRYFYELYNERPIQIRCYAGFGSLYYMILAILFAFWIILFSQFTLTCSILLKYPRIFTFGMFSDEGPAEERQEATMFKMKLRGKGWSEKLQDPIHQPLLPPNKEIVAKVSGKNPAYGLTCAAFALSAVMILTESNKMPDKGGVYPPGVAFAKTSIIEKLQENGVKFEIISES